LWVALAVCSLAGFVELAGAPLAFSAPARGTLAVVFFATLTLYNLDGRIDEEEKLSPSQARRRAHLILSLLSCAALIWYARALSTAAQTLTALGIGLSSLYALPSSGGASARGIKTLSGVKSPFVGVAVATAVVGLPHWGLEPPNSLAVSVVLWLPLALFCTANALLFDVVDRRDDAARKVPTVAVQKGVQAAQRQALMVTCAGLLVAPLAAFGLGGLALLHRAAPNLLALSALGVFLLVAAPRVNEQSSRDHVALLVDGGLFIPLAVRLLWTALSVQNT